MKGNVKCCQNPPSGNDGEEEEGDLQYLETPVDKKDRDQSLFKTHSAVPESGDNEPTIKGGYPTHRAKKLFAELLSNNEEIKSSQY